MDCPPRAARARLLSACLAWLSLVTAASAELPWSRLDALFPAGARAGTSVHVRLTGSELENSQSLKFSRPGITASRVADSSPSENLFEVQVAADVPPGLYDVSAFGDLGLSNARTFAVGLRDELSEAEPNDGPANATTVSIGSTMNGRIGKATDVDSFSFRATAGQKLIVDCLATRIDSPLLPVLEILDGRGRRVAFARSGRADDAVLVFEPPAEADYTLRVYDQTYRGGDEFVYRIELHTDPYVVAVQPVVGKAGTTSPAQVAGLNLPEAKTSDQRWRRWPLQLVETSIDFPVDRLGYDHVSPVAPPEAGVDSFAWRFTTSTGSSQPLRMQTSDIQAVREIEPNPHREQAQRLVLPAEVSGSFGTIGDVDTFSIEAKKDEPIWIEVLADRFGSKADAALRVDFLAEGASDPTRVAGVDDTHGDLLPLGFETHSDDPSYRFLPTANGTCFIQVRDQYGQTRGDASLVYRLVIRRPQPDFRLVAVPTSKGVGKVAPASLRKGDSLEFLIVAFRQEGFDGLIEIPASDLGGGLSTEETLIPKGVSSAPLVLRTNAEATPSIRVVELTGRSMAVSADPALPSLLRSVRPATTIRSTSKVQNRDVPGEVRLARQFLVGVADEIAPIEIAHEAPRQAVPQGASLEVPLRLTRRAGAEGPVTVAVQGLPKTANIAVPDVTFAAGETEKTVKLDVRSDAPAQTHLFHWVARTKIEYRRNRREREEARLALENISSRLRAAKDETNASGALTAAALKTLEEEQLAAEKRLQELDKAVKELEVSAVTSPFILDVQAVAAPAAAPN